MSGFGQRLRGYFAPREWVVDANDGIIATAGLLEGFAGAGVNQQVLLTAAIVMIVAGSLSVGGAKWAEAAAERDAQVALIAEESLELSSNPEGEIAELAQYWVTKGLDQEMALALAQKLSANDALAAQLEYEYGISEPTPSWEPAVTGVVAGLAFFTGALVPMLITIFVSGGLEIWAILVAVLISLSLTSILMTRSEKVPLHRTLIRTLMVGLGTLGIGFAVGTVLG